MAQRTLQANMDKGIYILGLGNLGKYVAYALMNSRSSQRHMTMQLHDPFPPVTLMFHRPGLVADWENAGSRISYTSELAPDPAHQPTTDELSRSARGCANHFRTELVGAPTTESEPAIIKHLIVATKTHATTAALASIKHRLNKDSHVMFLQNGMGMSLTAP
jgi:2-dehydropantoate 2-reductase